MPSAMIDVFSLVGQHNLASGAFVYDTGSTGKGLPPPLSELLEWLAERHSILVPNPFHEPPEAVVARGVDAVKEYFLDMFEDGFVAERRNVKAVIVGRAGAGKTR